MKNKNKNRPWLSKKPLMLLAVVLVAIGVGAIWYLRYRHQATPATSTSTAAINYGPATDQEKQQTEQHKQAIANSDTNTGQSPPSDSSLKSVTPIITGTNQDPQTHAY